MEIFVFTQVHPIKHCKNSRRSQASDQFQMVNNRIFANLDSDPIQWRVRFVASAPEETNEPNRAERVWIGAKQQNKTAQNNALLQL